MVDNGIIKEYGASEGALQLLQKRWSIQANFWPLQYQQICQIQEYLLPVMNDIFLCISMWKYFTKVDITM